MKLQLQNDSLRVRIDEAELAALQSGESLTLALGDPARPLFSMQLRLGGEPALQTDAVAWQLLLPSAAVADYVQTLPNRHALELSVHVDGHALAVQFEVDVRDSLQVRGARRRGEQASSASS